MLKGFRDFVMRGNVVDLAVGVVIGAAFNGLVEAFTKAFLTPLIQLVGGGDVAGAITLRAATATQEAIVLDYGSFISALISFLLTAAVLYFFVVQPMNMMNERLKRGQQAPVDEPSNEEKLLAEIRDELRRPRV
ncbi:large conductance mechanosensitive channel protein MscL [Deinococcus radiophilus]|uniref:Large-conductance mechanosensitive channel n=1 Tax=Deinococcus radiophilus TaxID=32062 RepID=A0A431W5P9_9DEIO|nr:large conductance mechanosensitive channel protein MscL [Deinococcus radiophilus]RTR30777.1 large conductance mechanosensitive channel protein MscL [Deinococcus radiophilus]UFA51333.1 large conductance mechanosensitive channel protein MscL [Deinococcus radiophilus]